MSFRKKELFKNVFMISLIMIIAVVSTYYIYHNVTEQRIVEFQTEALEVTFYEQFADRVTIRRAVPVRDSIGLSSRAYSFTIRNKSEHNVSYFIEIENDDLAIIYDDCVGYQIPHHLIRVSVHKRGERVRIYNLDELINSDILKSEIGPDEIREYTLRFWISEDANMNLSGLHFHGKITIIQLYNYN